MINTSGLSDYVQQRQYLAPIAEESMDPQTEEKRAETEKSPNAQPDAVQSSWQKWSAILLSNWRLKGALILMLLIAGMYGWKNLSVRQLEKETAKQTAKLTEST